MCGLVTVTLRMLGLLHMKRAVLTLAINGNDLEQADKTCLCSINLPNTECCHRDISAFYQVSSHLFCTGGALHFTTLFSNVQRAKAAVSERNGLFGPA